MGSQYSDDAFNTHDSRLIESQIDIGRQMRDSQIDIHRDGQLRDSQRDIHRDTRRGSYKFDMSLDRLTADIDLEKTDTDLSKSLPDRDKDESRKEIGQSIRQRSQSKLDPQQVKDTVPGTVHSSREGGRNPRDQDLTDGRWQPDTGYDIEERQLMARFKELSFQERRVTEERLRRQNAEKEMERKLKALQLKKEELHKEGERKERLRALKLQTERMQAKLLEDEDEGRKCENRIERMYQKTQKLEEHIAEREREYGQPEIISYTARDNAYERQQQEQLEEKFREVERQRSLEDELKRRETLVKQEMEEERHRKLEAEEIARRIYPQGTEEELRRQEWLSRQQQYEDNMRQRQTQLKYREEEELFQQEHFRRETMAEARNREVALRREFEDAIQRREEQMRKQFEEELRHKEMELERKEEMLQKLMRILDGQEKEPMSKLLQRKEELEKKEKYLRQLEEEQLNKQSGVETNIKCDTAPPKAEVTHFLKPYLTQFSGAEPTPKNESTFEDWKAETQCLIKTKVYPDYIVTQAIRNSLKGQARKALATLDPLTNSDGIISKLESLFGNVASGLSVLQEFFTAVQREDESVTMWGLRIEEILQRAMEKGEVPPERKNHLLKDKFWRSLHSLDLKIATKVYFDKVTDFEVLRSKVREEERELQAHKTTFEKSSSSMTANNKQDTSGELQHQPIQTQLGAAKMYGDIAKRLEKIEKFCSYRRRRFPNKNQNKENDKQIAQQQQQQQRQQQPRQQQPHQQQQQQQQQQSHGINNTDIRRTDNKTNTLNRDRPPLQGK